MTRWYRTSCPRYHCWQITVAVLWKATTRHRARIIRNEARIRFLTRSGIGRGTRPTRTIANECMQGRSKPSPRARFQTVCLTASLSFRLSKDQLFYSCSICLILAFIFISRIHFIIICFEIVLTLSDFVKRNCYHFIIMLILLLMLNPNTLDLLPNGETD